MEGTSSDTEAGKMYGGVKTKTKKSNKAHCHQCY